MSEERPGPAGRTLVVGRTRANLRAHKVDAWPRDTIHVGYGRGDIAVLGQGPQGTLLAAYQFLRDQGCRWYIPDHLDGRHIPRRARLALPDEPRQHTPSFKERGWYPAPTRPGAWDANYDWGVRNGVNALISVASVNYGAARGHGLGLRGGHTIWVLIPSADHPDAARTFAEHPEWYPLVGGRRVYQYVNGMPVQACVSNRQVVQDVARQVIEYFRQHPECWRFSVSPFDEPTYWCECDACRAMDDPASTWRVNDRTDAICLQSKAGPGPMTDRFVKFVNRVARIVARECPGKYVSFYAYGSTVAPPRAKDWKLEPNVVVEFAHYYGSTLCLKHAADDPQCPHNAPMHKWLTEWTSRPNGGLVWENATSCPGPSVGTPYCVPTQVNSLGLHGRLAGTGSGIVASAQFVLDARDLPAGVPAYALASRDTDLVVMPPGSQGTLCLGGSIGRMVDTVAFTKPNGRARFPVFLERIPTTPEVAVMPGETWRFQAWYRDMNPGPTSNFTEALEVVFQ